MVKKITVGYVGWVLGSRKIRSSILCEFFSWRQKLLLSGRSVEKWVYNLEEINLSHLIVSKEPTSLQVSGYF